MMFRDPNVPISSEKEAYQPQTVTNRQQLQPQSIRPIEEIKQEVNVWDVDTGAAKVVDNGGELSQEEMNGMREELGGRMQQEFIKGDASVEEEKAQEAQEMFKQKEQYKDLRLSLAQDYLDGTISNAFTRTPMGQEIMEKMLKDQRQLVKKKCPEGEECEDKNSLGVMLTDYDLLDKTEVALDDVNAKIEKLTGLYNTGGVDDDGVQMDELLKKQKEYTSLIESKPQIWTNLQKLGTSIVKSDKASFNVLEDARTKIYKKGLDVLPEDDISFNEEQTLQTVNNVIMGKGNLQSMIYDTMIPGFQKNGEPRSFYSDLKDHIMGTNEGGRTYRDFGITDEMMGQGDTNADGVIDDTEAENIAQQIVNDDGLVREQLSNYFVQYLKSNWELGLNGRREKYIKEEVGGKEKRDALDKLGGYTPQTKEDRIERNKGILEKDIKNTNTNKPQSLNTDWAN